MKFTDDLAKLVCRVYNFFKAEGERGRPLFSISKYRKRSAKALGISVSKLSYILQKRDEIDTTSGGSISKAIPAKKVDSFQKEIIRNTIRKFFAENRFISLRILKTHLKKEHSLTVSKHCLWKLLHSFGYCYKKILGESRHVLCERKDVVSLRNNYLRTIKKKREQGYEVVYLDETWVNACHTAQRQWVSTDAKTSRKLPLGKGERLIVLHAGCEGKGFLPGCELVFRSKSKDNRDYHTEMNGNVFLEWTETQLIPALPKKSLIVMDNASYHSVQDPDTKAPTSNSRKGDMVNWLETNNVPFPTKATKPVLYNLIKLNKTKPVYKVDKLLHSHGHDVLRLPPYHCDLNPIEMIWGIVKGDVGRKNETFKLSDVQNLVTESLGNITQVVWARCVAKVVNDVESAYWKRDGLRHATVTPIVISVDSDVSDRSDSENSEEEF